MNLIFRGTEGRMRLLFLLIIWSVVAVYVVGLILSFVDRGPIWGVIYISYLSAILLWFSVKRGR